MKSKNLHSKLLKNFNYTKFNIPQVIKCHLVNPTRNEMKQEMPHAEYRESIFTAFCHASKT